MQFLSLRVSVYLPLINFWTTEPIFLKLVMYITAPKPMSTAYFIDPSHQSLCLYVYPLQLLGNVSVDMIPRQQIQARIE
jgi:hypothetical protein